MIKPRLIVPVVIFRLFIFLLPLSACATLGQHKSSSQEAQKEKNATQKIYSKNGYEIHEKTSEGQVIREYVSDDGVVFAVSWRGMDEPDLSYLLGSYYDEASHAMKRSSRSAGRTAKVGQTSNVVIEKFGHMRDVRGKAYVRSLVPSNVNPEDLQ